MNAIKILAILLIVGGALGLAYGGFSYTKETHRADIGPLHFQMNESEHVNIPLWAGIGAVVVGGVLLLAASRKA
jgi:TRAP-type C4-dicarboxylate transport system permease small subunit